MAELSEATLEQEVGDHTQRMRLVNDIVDGGTEYRADTGDEWFFGPLVVGSHAGDDDYITATSPDGDLYEIKVPDVDEPNRSLAVEEELRNAWEDWMGEL